MGFGLDFPEVSGGNPYVGNNLFATVDPFNAALENNGAANSLGSIYQAPLNLDQVPVGSAANVPGIGLNDYYKYVRYNPTTSEAIQAGPALVYWKDETFTTVTGLSTEAFINGPNGVAGWLLYNTTAVPGATAAQINGNFCWILVGGFLSLAYLGVAASAGASIEGTASGAAWLATTPATAGNIVAAIALTASVSTAFLADLYVPLIN